MRIRRDRHDPPVFGRCGAGDNIAPRVPAAPPSAGRGCGACAMPAVLTKRVVQRSLILIALGGIVLGGVAWAAGRHDIARWTFAAGTVPVAFGLLVSMIRDLVAGRMGVDAVAFLSMTGALGLGETLAGIVVAIMYAGGNVLEDFAVGRAERDLKSLVDRAPRVAHRRTAAAVEDVSVDA